MGMALMLGMLVTPFAEEAFGRLGTYGGSWELESTQSPHAGNAASRLRYMEKHTAIPMGAVAVIMIAIMMASKQL